MGNLLNKLREYLTNASPQEIQENWDELKEWNEVGTLASEYIEACLEFCVKQVIVFKNIEESSEFSLNFPCL